MDETHLGGKVGISPRQLKVAKERRESKNVCIVVQSGGVRENM